MNEFQTNNQELLDLIGVWEPKLSALGENDITARRNSQNRNIKQIVGHLVDSASNNTHRIIHLQYQPSPLAFPDYANFGNNDRWIAIQNYESENWINLVQLWKYTNLHIIHVINHVNEDKLDNQWISAKGEYISLKKMIVDYLRHVKLHLGEIEELIKDNLPPLIIAIDGYSSCGKSTFAKAIAQKLGYAYIDTGAMYRAVTLFALQNGLIQNGVIDIPALNSRLDDIHISFRRNLETGENETFLNSVCVERDIRTIAVSESVSEIAAIKEVRQKLVSLQQIMGKDKAIVMDGRDIGTNVFPDADIKIFMTASPEVRTQRRYDELVQKGMPASWDEIFQNLSKRDHIDQTRDESPLRQADDAIVLDNSNMTPEEQMVWFDGLKVNV